MQRPQQVIELYEWQWYSSKHLTGIDMTIREIKISTDGTQVSVFDYENQVIVDKGSLRDATEAVEKVVLESMYFNGVGYFNADHTISAMVVNLDLRGKMEKIIAEQKELGNTPKGI